MTELQNDQTYPKPGLLELVYGTLFNPVATFNRVSTDPPVFYSFIIFIAVVILNSIVDAVLPQELAGMPPELSIAVSQAGPVITVIGAILSILIWFLQAGILQVLSELLGGQGRALGTLTVLALSGLPGVLAIPFNVASYFLRESFAGTFLSVAGALLAGIWALILLIIGIRQVHNLSTGRAVAVVVAPVVVLIAFVIVLVVSLLVFAAPFLGQGTI